MTASVGHSHHARGFTSYWCDLAVIEPDGDVLDTSRATAGVTLAERVTIDVAGGRIASIRVSSDPPAEATILHGLTVAGFANAHSHAFHRALRGRTQADTGSFWTWRDVMYRAAERLDPDRYFRLARATFAEMALAGVSTVGEFHYVHHQPDGMRYADQNAMGVALLAAATDAGVRITLLDTMYLHGGIVDGDHRRPSGVQIRYADESAGAWADRVDELTGRVDLRTQRVGAAVHSVRAVDPDAMQVVAHWANVNNAPVHAHVSEQPAENEQCVAVHGVTPTALLAGAGLVDDRFTAVHATHLTDADVALLGAGRSFVCMCPTTERDLGDGIGPTVRLADADVALCLGTDSHAMIDLLEEARAVELNERLGSLRRGNHRPIDLLRMASDTGHASLGWHDAGTIRVDRRADLTTISLQSIRTAGSSRTAAVEAAIFGATASDITSVVIDGAPVVVEGRHRSIDVAAELQASITELLDP